MFEERTRLIVDLHLLYASALTKMISESQPPLSSKLRCFHVPYYEYDVILYTLSTS